MKTNYSTLKISSSNKPKFYIIPKSKYKVLNNFLHLNNNKKVLLNHNNDNPDDKSKNNFTSINSFRQNNQYFQKILPNYRYTMRNTHLNPARATYTNGQFNRVYKNNFRNLFSKEQTYLDSLKRKKNIRRVKNQGIETIHSSYNRNKSKIFFRNLSLGKDENNLDNLTSFNNEGMKEFYFNLTGKLVRKFPLTKVISHKILKDKYAYIYMSDKSELIKHWRRTNYNPLNV
jgi:hypothetical protein